MRAPTQAGRHQLVAHFYGASGTVSLVWAVHLPGRGRERGREGVGREKS